MKFLIVLLGLVATQTLANPVDTKRAALESECGALGVMDWDQDALPEGTTDSTQLRHCEKHPSELGISSPLENPDAAPEDLSSSYGRAPEPETSPVEDNRLEKKWECSTGGRGLGPDYDYGCDKGWCWRNCKVWENSLSLMLNAKKPWCWLAYDGGKKSWTPCGRWQDCEWSYNNKNARCGVGSCKACGCGC